MSAALRFRHLVAFVALALVSSACTQVLETQMIWPDSPASEPQCHSALGYYYLPRTLLSLQVKSDKALAQQFIIAWGVETHADRNQAFCLDYLASPAAIDNVVVQRTEEGLLTSINASVEDRTPAIVTALVQTAENFAIAGARSTAVPGQVETLNIQFDPFVWDELMLAKAELRRFGMCLYVEGFSFSTEGMTAAEVRAAASRWCSTDAHATPRYDPRGYTFATLPVPPEVMRAGILYRPMATHRVVILRQKSGVWELYQNKRIEMPNASPVLSIGVQRAAFTTRKTTLYFNNGTLTDVAVDKNSEAEGFVVIPLAVAKAITDIPAQIVQVRLADVQSHAALIQAQGNLVNATAQYAALVAANNGGSGTGGAGRAGVIAGPGSADYRNGQFVAGCVDSSPSASLDVCKSLAGKSQ
jgi:hypothetical protein